MLTPFKEDNSIDFGALDALVDWYVENGVSGLFAACKSSEVFNMTLAERIALSKACCKRAGSLPVVVSGHIASSEREQIYELQAMADTGAAAIVLITNRFALPGENDDVWKMKAEKLINQIPESIPLGLYECPYPFRHYMSPRLLRWCAETGRFHFFKDTCGNLPSLKSKIQALTGSGMKLFDANPVTLQKSLQLGGNGYCGVMANFYPDLLVWMTRNYNCDFAEELSSFFALSSLVESRNYPVCAKYNLQLKGLPLQLTSRCTHEDLLNLESKMIVEALYRMGEEYRGRLSLSNSVCIEKEGMDVCGK